MPLPLIQGWIEGFRDAWRQAKHDYEMSKAHTLKKSTRFDDVRRVRRGPGDRAAARGKRKNNATDSSRNSRRVAVTKANLSGDPRKVHDATLGAADGSILDASFLRSIERDDNRRAQTTMGPPRIRLTDDTRVMPPITKEYITNEKDRRGAIAASETTTKTALKRTHSSVLSISDINEEYIVQVQRRVRQLEAELEMARSRLSVYEQGDSRATPPRRDYTTRPLARDSVPRQRSASPPSRVRDPDTSLPQEDEVSTTSPTTQSGSKQQQSMTSDEPTQRPDAATGSCTPQRDKQLTEETTGIDGFCLSPVPLEFSPVRVELADVSNGEIARKEALHALKQCLKGPAWDF